MLPGHKLRTDHIEFILALYAVGLCRDLTLDLFKDKYGFRISERAYNYALENQFKVTPKGVARVIDFILERNIVALRPIPYVLLDNIEHIESLIKTGVSYQHIAEVLEHQLDRQVSEDQIKRAVKKIREEGKPHDYFERQQLWSFLISVANSRSAA